MGGDGGTYHERAVELQRPGPYRVGLGVDVLAGTAVSTGESVALRLDVHEGYPRLVCEPDGDGRALTRTVTARAGERRPAMTLPAQFVEAGGLVGSHAVAYSRPGDDRLYVGFDRESRVRVDGLSEIGETFVSRRSSGDLAVTISERVAGPLASVETLQFSVDHYGGQLFFVLDATEALAPPGALEITANPNTGRTGTAGLSFLFPRVIGRLGGVGSTTLRWGRAGGSNRLLGTIREASA